jgi:hypothetical protein
VLQGSARFDRVGFDQVRVCAAMKVLAHRVTVMALAFEQTTR